MKTLQFPGSNNSKKILKKLDQNDSIIFGEIFDSIINYSEMALSIFCVCTIRLFENEILTEPEKYFKKTKYIKKLLREKFTSPSIGTFLDLSRNCFYLIDDKNSPASSKILEMKSSLEKSFELGPISFLLNDLNKILSHSKSDDPTKTKTIYLEINKLNHINKLIPQLVYFRNQFKHSRDLILTVEENFNELNLNTDNWLNAHNFLINSFLPILNHKYILKSLGKVVKSNSIDDKEKEPKVSIQVQNTIYDFDKTYNSIDEICFSNINEIEDYQADNHSELILSDGVSEKIIDLFPFLIINDDKLYFYKTTKAKGYEYFSVVDNSFAVFPTKKKFNHTAFKTIQKGDQQAFFWTDAPPIINPTTKVRANIPTEGLIKFVGRKKQLKIISEEIIQIPNQNGILYGPGGVGKTALMIELSKNLFNTGPNEDSYFPNIIWVSAKKDYYNPIHNVVEEKDKKIESLDHIFSAILGFFDFEDIDEYDHDDKKEFCLEILSENRIVLIIDNFETISRQEQDKILRFFGIEVKKHLKRNPDNFKVIVTSREQIPSGFHQIKLKGLDAKDSKQLINRFLEKYANTGNTLSEEQKDAIYKLSNGIPIIIIHCIGQIFEFNISYDAVCCTLREPTSEIIKFSYSEVFKQLEKDHVKLNLLILLDLIKIPLMIRQASDILEIAEQDINSSLPILINFQCIERVSQGLEEKFTINDEIRLFTQSLIHRYSQIANEIRSKISKNFTFDKKLDYTSDELRIIEIFENHILNNNFLDAEEFINAQIKKNSSSVLLRMHYAKYLKEKKRDFHTSSEILKNLVNEGIKHPSILRLLISCYISLDVPLYDRANKYINELTDFSSENCEINFELAEFYAGWSASIRIRGTLIDPIQEIERTGKYKELAQESINYLDLIKDENRNHKYYYLAAISYFNLWKNDIALDMINRAIDLIGQDPKYNFSYNKLKSKIMYNINKKKSFSQHKQYKFTQHSA